MGWFKKDPLQIIAFATYGTKTHLYLKGRALEDENIDLEKKGWLNLFINSWKRFETDEVRNTALRIQLPNETSIECTSDNEGYFLIDQTSVNLLDFINSEGWLLYEISYASDHGSRKIQSNNCFLGSMMIPKPNSRFGVISDIDDTILDTGVVSRLKWRVVFNTIFVSPNKRKALEGTAEFYHHLHRGKSNDEANPIFYVSNSPWNLYEYLEYFLRHNNFPKGPILLRDIRMPYDRTPKPKLSHKYHEIFNIINTYADLKFILIGDCGEKDADIFIDVVREFPNRIAAIYLRAVKHTKRMKRITALFKDYKEVPVLIVEESSQAIAHAKTHGFINE